MPEHRRVRLYKRLMHEIECEKSHKRTVSQELPKELYSRLLWEEEGSPRHPREPSEVLIMRQILRRGGGYLGSTA